MSPGLSSRAKPAGEAAGAQSPPAGDRPGAVAREQIALRSRYPKPFCEPHPPNGSFWLAPPKALLGTCSHFQTSPKKSQDLSGCPGFSWPGLRGSYHLPVEPPPTQTGTCLVGTSPASRPKSSSDPTGGGRQSGHHRRKLSNKSTGSSLEGLQAGSISISTRSLARASPNRAPAWSRWVPSKLHRCKEQQQDRSAIRVRENPKPVKVKARVERQRGWARVRAWVLPAPVHPLH